MPSNGLRFLRVDVFGMKGENVIGGGVLMLWNHGWVIVAGFTAIYVLILPFFRFGLLTVVLGAWPVPLLSAVSGSVRDTTALVNPPGPDQIALR